ncbi:MAG: electron transfer flavoprotein subunit alpha/FixB family protein [Anaerolineae bacterium]|nr:electron transfer flavoprotein subunit alpha/FixB family protein [Anaerolineae bacterium]
MSNDILVITEHMDGKVADISFEMVGKARELTAAWDGQVVAVMLGSGAPELAGAFASDMTLYVDDPALAEFNPEAYGRVIAALVADRSPKVTMLGNTSQGMDLAAWLSVKTGQPCLAYVNNLTVEDGTLIATSQIYGGKMLAEATPDGESVVVSVLAGAFSADAGRGATAAQLVGAPVPLSDLKTKFIKLIRPEAGDVDITSQDKLVSVGRGIGSADNIGLAKELAEALGAVISASRPVTDAGWLPKTRQVGKSGVSVKPKLYLALGISGAPEHLEGMKDAELIVAVNTDAKAPIFKVAHYGATCDLFEVAEAMLEKLG